VADNVLKFDSGSSPFKEFQIDQNHATVEEIHDHVERPIGGDGWSSIVRRIGTDEIRGPFAFLGDAMAEMRRWAAEGPSVAEIGSVDEVESKRTSKHRKG
jgi:hypothetical protein